MARIRTIKPDFFNSFDIASLTPLARLFYAYLWTESDRDGYLEWKPKNFRMRFFPTDQYDASELGDELVNQGLIVISDDGICHIPEFTKHQVINNRESESTLKSRVNDACTRVKAEGRKEGREGSDASKRKRFSPPSLDDVKTYCEERDNHVDPVRFVNFYEMKGWQVGKEKMKDWKAAVRTWEKDDKQASTVGELIWN